MEAVQAKAALDSSTDNMNEKLVSALLKMTETVSSLEDRTKRLETLVVDLTTALEASMALSDKKSTSKK
eukprot:m.258064 g.258064  ORF g.258064 m.258064 type:complete len:69 (-) comp19643_c0_seq1:37-243(-)